MICHYLRGKAHNQSIRAIVTRTTIPTTATITTTTTTRATTTTTATTTTNTHLFSSRSTFCPTYTTTTTTPTTPTPTAATTTPTIAAKSPWMSMVMVGSEKQKRNTSPTQGRLWSVGYCHQHQHQPQQHQHQPQQHQHQHQRQQQRQAPFQLHRRMFSTGRTQQHEFFVNRGKLIQTLSNDIPRYLTTSVHLDQSLFEPGLRVVLDLRRRDVHYEMTGIQRFQHALDRLRWIATLLLSRSDVSVRFVPPVGCSKNDEIQVRIRAVLYLRGIVLSSPAPKPIVFECVASYFLNESGRVHTHVITDIHHLTEREARAIEDMIIHWPSSHQCPSAAATAMSHNNQHDNQAQNPVVTSAEEASSILNSNACTASQEASTADECIKSERVENKVMHETDRVRENSVLKSMDLSCNDQTTDGENQNSSKVRSNQQHQFADDRAHSRFDCQGTEYARVQ